MQALDIGLWVVGGVLAAVLVGIVWGYVKGLSTCPRELWILYGTKIIEYTAYGALNMTLVFYLREDCGLPDPFPGKYVGYWSVILSAGGILVGSVCDALGIKKTLLIGTALLLVSRLCLPLVSNIYLASVLGFLPLAFGLAFLGPVLSVGIKRYTTKEQSVLGFGLFYTLMNVGWALGAWLFDYMRLDFVPAIAGSAGTVRLPVVGVQMSSWQTIFAAAFLLTIPTFVLVLLMRDGVAMNEAGVVVITPAAQSTATNPLAALRAVTSRAITDTGRIFAKCMSEKAFWIFLLMLTVLVFVRLVFFHFHYTFPTYGMRLLGENIKVAHIYGVLNPVLIVFLTPLISLVTRKVGSYRMMLVGTALSSVAVFIATLPGEPLAPLVDTWFGELVYDRWLGIAPAQQNPYILVLVAFVILFTIGEAIWSPRLMQFTAAIAPEGREGSYIALSYLPFFLSKFVVGQMSGFLLAEYVPEGQTTYPNQYMVWVWIGAMAAISPLGLLVFSKLFRRAETAGVKSTEGTA